MAITKIDGYNALSDIYQFAEATIDSKILADLTNKRMLSSLPKNKLDDYLKVSKNALLDPQKDLTQSISKEATSLDDAEKASEPGALYGNADEVISPGMHINSSLIVQHPCVINYDIPIEGSSPRPGYLMFYAGQDTNHSHILAAQALVPTGFTKHVNVLSPPNIGDSDEYDTEPQQLAYPFVLKVRDSTDPYEKKYLILYTAENQNVDGTLNSTSCIKVCSWTGEIDPNSGEFTYTNPSTGIKTSSLSSVSLDGEGNPVYSEGGTLIANTPDVPSVYSPYAEYDDSTGDVHIWFSGLDAKSNTSGIYYVTTTLANCELASPAPLTIPSEQFLSLPGTEELISENPAIKRKSGDDLELGNHLIGFRGKLISRGPDIYRHFWLSTEAFGNGVEYVCLYGVAEEPVTSMNYNPGIQIHNVVGDVDDFPTAVTRCFYPAILSMEGESIFYTWWTSGSESKSFISFAGNKSTISKMWVETPASVVFNETLGTEKTIINESSDPDSYVNAFKVFSSDTANLNIPMSLPVYPTTTTNIGQTIYNVDFNRVFNFTTLNAFVSDDAPEEAIETSKFDKYTGRDQENKDIFLPEKYTCTGDETLDLIASLYYKDYISASIPYGVIQYTGLISEVNDNISDADLYPGLQLNIPDPRELLN